MTHAAPVANVVVNALVAEFVRMRNKVQSAASRLAHANRQAEIETNLLAEHQADLDMLADAILSNGGMLPPADEDAISVAARMAT
jgi:hypothetical protein